MIFEPKRKCVAEAPERLRHWPAWLVLGTNGVAAERRIVKKLPELLPAVAGASMRGVRFGRRNTTPSREFNEVIRQLHAICQRVFAPTSTLVASIASGGADVTAAVSSCRPLYGESGGSCSGDFGRSRLSAARPSQCFLARHGYARRGAQQARRLCHGRQPHRMAVARGFGGGDL